MKKKVQNTDTVLLTGMARFVLTVQGHLISAFYHGFFCAAAGCGSRIFCIRLLDCKAKQGYNSTKGTRLGSCPR